MFSKIFTRLFLNINLFITTFVKKNEFPFVFSVSFFSISYYFFNFLFYLNLNKNEEINILLILIFVIPIVLGLLGRFLGRIGVIFFIILSYSFLISFLITVVYLFLTDANITHILYFGEWINLGSFDVKWEFAVDNISLTMLIIVLTITFCVLLYSIGYLYEDPHLIRFLFYISLFSLFMVILITATNFIVLFMGWEGVGICSYLLISFWFTRLKALKAALKAVVMNRIGDTGVLMGIVLSVLYFQTLDFTEILILSDSINNTLHTFICHLICICLFLGVIGKSAQLGLHTWLLLAMEGPTPASALIHAATMVTAGIFLIIRLSTLFSNAPGILIFATFVGSITALFAGLCGLIQTDMKRIVAFSTTSQLGYMLLTCGLSHYSLAFFHLINHAFFKAMLFMCMGIIIHILSNEQDLRKSTNLITIIPLVYTAIQIGNSALTGFIFTSGFFSKDLILEITILQRNFFIDSITQQIAFLTAILTFIYSSRVLYYVFLNSTQISNKHNLHFSNNISYMYSTIATIPLLILSVVFGFFFRTYFIGPTNIFENTVAIYTNLLENNYLISVTAELLPFYIKNLPALLCLLVCLFSLICFDYLTESLIKQSIYNTKQYSMLYVFFYKTKHFLYYRWYSDKFFDQFFSKLLHIGQNYVIEILERGLLDYTQNAEKNSLKFVFKKIYYFIATLENVNIQVYLGFIIISLLTLFILL
jgi:proton-translocating NADH-quinone oxidoreductase chain L